MFGDLYPSIELICTTAVTWLVVRSFVDVTIEGLHLLAEWKFRARQK